MPRRPPAETSRSVVPVAARGGRGRAAPDAQRAPDEPSDDDLRRAAVDDSAQRIVSRPDGYYWVAPDGRQEIGPFDSYAEAAADMDSDEVSGFSPGDAVAEAESEFGVSDWIDPDSGQLAEGQSPPHLSE